MALRKAFVRDILIVSLLIGSALFVWTRPEKKSEAEKKIDLASILPAETGAWESRTMDTSSYRDKWQSINELLVRRYAKPNPFSIRGPAFESVALIAEYSSDLRQNFSFHFPENCHRAGGNQIQFLEPLDVEMPDGRKLTAKTIYIQGRPGSIEPTDKIVTYWLVIGDKPCFETFFVKLDQMLSGLLSRAKEGVLVRVDYDHAFEYSPEGIEKARTVTANFLRDLYGSLGPSKRLLIFGSSQKNSLKQ